jgi:hypothetical protein
VVPVDDVDLPVDEVDSLPLSVDELADGELGLGLVLESADATVTAPRAMLPPTARAATPPISSFFRFLFVIGLISIISRGPGCLRDVARVEDGPVDSLSATWGQALRSNGSLSTGWPSR